MFAAILLSCRYICLGKRALFLIDFEPPFQEQFYYAWVQRVIIDTDNLLLFQIDFSEGRAPLLLESFERDRLCAELAICWKADSMFRQWRWQPFPLKRGPCEVKLKERTATEFTAAPDKMKRVELNGYFLFLDDTYRPDPPGVSAALARCSASLAGVPRLPAGVQECSWRAAAGVLRLACCGWRAARAGAGQSKREAIDGRRSKQDGG